MEEKRTRIKLIIGSETYNITELVGKEELSAPYKLTASFISNTDVAGATLAGTKAYIELAERKIHGIITNVRAATIEKSRQQITCTLEPQLILTKLSKTIRVIQDQTVPEIITEILRNCGYQKSQIKHHLNNSYKAKPYRMQILNETNFSFIQRLLAFENIFYWIDSDDQQEIIHLADDIKFSPYIAPTTYDPHKVTAGFNKLKFAQNRLQATSNLCDLKVGCSTSLNADKLSLYLSQDYFIQKIEHQAQQKIEHQGQEIAYQNQTTLYPRAQQITTPKVPPPEFSGHHIAHTESQGQYPDLAENGELLLRQRFDLSGKPNTSASPSLLRLMPYGGIPHESAYPIGWIQPLPPGAEVLVSYQNNDPDEAVVLGTIPNSHKTSPVTSSNNQQNLIRSLGKNQLLMDDTKDQEKIALSTYGQNNLLELNATKGQHQIKLITEKGAINWDANKNLNLQSGANLKENIKHNETAIANNNYKVKTAKDINYQATTEQKTKALKDLGLQAQDTHITCDNNNIKSKNTEITTKDSIVNTQDNLTLKSIQNLNLTNNLKTEISQSQGGISIDSTNAINFLGKELNLEAEQGLKIKGKVNHIPTPALPTKLTNIPKVKQPKAIEDLTPPTAKQKTTTSEQQPFYDEFATEFNSRNQTLTKSKWIANDDKTKKAIQFTGKEMTLPKDLSDAKIYILEGM
jgi:uncharacterized protein involved in type VI secretion and phage assembly